MSEKLTRIKLEIFTSGGATKEFLLEDAGLRQKAIDILKSEGSDGFLALLMSERFLWLNLDAIASVDLYTEEFVPGSYGGWGRLDGAGVV